MHGNISSKKGFFFVIIVFVILGYILVSLSVWTSALQESERRYADRFRTSNLELIAMQITDEEIRQFSDIALYDALKTLNGYSVDNPVRSGGGADSPAERTQIRAIMYDLFSHGTTEGTHFENPLAQLPSMRQSATFRAWIDRLNTSISQTGMQVSNYSISNFDVFQNTRENVSYSFNLHLILEEKNRISFIERDYAVSGDLPISGLIDPAITRAWKTQKSGNIEKQFFFYSPYSKDSDLVPAQVFGGAEGQGWFYGLLVSADEVANNPGAIDPIDREKYILFGTYGDILNIGARTNNAVDHTEFGAYILVEKPRLVASACPTSPDEEDTFNAIQYNSLCVASLSAGFEQTDKPFVVISGFTSDHGALCPDLEGNQNASHCALFVTRYSPREVLATPENKLSANGRLFNIENLRDFAACSYYTGNERSPSYFQRLFSNSFTRSSSNYGIETFMVGSYIGGHSAVISSPQTTYPDDVSRAARELFTGIQGTKVRGMPGCKDFEMCSQPSLVGHFRLGTGAQDDFLGPQRDTLACVPGVGAECG